MCAAPTPSVPLVRLRRAGREESLHRGHVVVLEGGTLRWHAGDAQRLVFVRSSIKPIQALTGITSGAVERFGLDARAVAVACASHMGREEHVQTVRALLAAAGLDEAALGCGGHFSFDPAVAREQVLPATGLPAVWSNCSGKHAMMLAASRALGAPLGEYLHPAHAVQRSILADIVELAGVPADGVQVAVDGCGAPAPALALEAFARSFSGLMRAARTAGHRLEAAARAVLSAMPAHPTLVAGPGRFDTDLMTTAKGLVVAKAGAEGVHVTMVPSRDLVVAAKVEDGSDRGYRGVVIGLLERLGVLDRTAADGLRQRQADPVLCNWAGDEVGRMDVLLPDALER
jgi:L-asparaginase II